MEKVKGILINNKILILDKPLGINVTEILVDIRTLIENTKKVKNWNDADIELRKSLEKPYHLGVKPFSRKDIYNEIN